MISRAGGFCGAICWIEMLFLYIIWTYIYSQVSTNPNGETSVSGLSSH